MVAEFLLSLLVRIVIPEFPKFVKLLPAAAIFLVSGTSTGVVTAKGLTGGVEGVLKSNTIFFYYFINCSRGLTASKPST